jgi:V8-like Glu-specific endopeptidase
LGGLDTAMKGWRNMARTYRIKPARIGKIEGEPAHQRPPLTVDDLARRDDQPATASMPEEVRHGLAHARVTVTMMSDALTLDEDDGHHPQNGTQSELILPEGSFVGIKVRDMKLHERGVLTVPDRLLTPARPAWQRLQHSPRPSSVERTRLRRINGRLVVPTDSGRVYGEYPARLPFYPSGYPWGCIGRLFVWADATSPNWSSYGSATLIGTSAILTAAHMVPWGSGGNWKALFVAGYYDGSSAAGPGGQSWVTSAHGYAGNSVSAHDMAVMRLQNPLGSWLGYMGVKAYDDGWEGGAYWSLVGYPSAVTSERPSWQGGIHVIDDDEDGDGQELEHHGDDTGGDSGGPFFGTWDDGPYVIGTVSGYEEVSGFLGIGSEDNNIVAAGPALIGICSYARQNWP